MKKTKKSYKRRSVKELFLTSMERAGIAPSKIKEAWRQYLVITTPFKAAPVRLNKTDSKKAAAALSEGKVLMRTKSGKLRCFNLSTLIKLSDKAKKQHKKGKLGRKAKKA